MAGWCATDRSTWACSIPRATDSATPDVAQLVGGPPRRRHERHVIHLWIPLPQTPPWLRRRAHIHTKSVTHVLGLKCHPCARSLRPRVREVPQRPFAGTRFRCLLTSRAWKRRKGGNVVQVTVGGSPRRPSRAWNVAQLQAGRGGGARTGGGGQH